VELNEANTCGLSSSLVDVCRSLDSIPPIPVVTMASGSKERESYVPLLVLRA
jgi:hypothetical protein